MENPVTDVKPIIEKFLDEVITALAEGQRIEIRGFGSFYVKNRKTRIGRNPRTGAAVPIPEYKTISFKFSRDAKDSFERASGSGQSVSTIVKRVKNHCD
jgi:integration host factor subunit beta